MPELKNRQFLDFEKPIKDLYDQVEILKTSAEKSKTDMSAAIASMEQRIIEVKKEINESLTPWQRVQLTGQALHIKVHTKNVYQLCGITWR